MVGGRDGGEELMGGEGVMEVGGGGDRVNDGGGERWE